MTTPSFLSLVDLAAERLGGRVLSCSDDFFAEKENLIKEEDAVFKAGLYTDRGKWMDGWESRRKRTPGHDWAVIALGTRGVVRGLDVDTSHFRGNHPPHFAMEGRDGSGPWRQMVDKTPISEDAHNFVAVEGSVPVTHVRLNIFPDGGVARLRVYGDVVPELPTDGSEFELSALRYGGRTLSCSNEHFCKMGHLLLPDQPRNMGDGWETRRRRGLGHDWVEVRLAGAAIITRIEIDTAHYKGNYPDRFSLEGRPRDSESWTEVLPETAMKPDHLHVFRDVMSQGPFDHVRLNIFPDGGVARLRVFGCLT